MARHVPMETWDVEVKEDEKDRYFVLVSKENKNGTAQREWER